MLYLFVESLLLPPQVCKAENQSKGTNQSVKEVKERVEQGYRMEAPEECPPTVYALMRGCWEAEPKKRPSFHKLQEKIERELTKHSPGPAC